MKKLSSIKFFSFLASFFLGLVLTGTAFGFTNNKLNTPLVSGGGVSGFTLQISPKSNLVTYSVNSVSQGEKNIEVFSVPIAGGKAPTKLSPLLSVPDDGSISISDNTISPDGNRVIFEISRFNSNPGSDGSFPEFSIYSTPIDGSTDPVKLNVPVDPPTFSPIFDISISRDSNWVVYRTVMPPFFNGSLTSIPIDGSRMPIKLAESSGQISPDSSRVVYTKDSGLFSIAIDGSSMPVRLVASQDLGGEDVQINDINFTPDGSRVVFTAFGAPTPSQTIYSVPVNGSAAPIKLNTADGRHVGSVLITQDGSRVVYLSGQSAPLGQDEPFTGPKPNALYTAPVDGSAKPVKLTLPFPDSSFGVTDFIISPDGKRAAYETDIFHGDKSELNSVLLDGSAMPIKLNSSFSLGFITDLTITPDNKWLVFRARLKKASNRELYSVPIEGGMQPILLNPPNPSGDEIIFSPQFSSNGSRVVFSAELETDGVRELYSVPIDGSVIPVKLNAPLVSGGNVDVFDTFKVSLDDNYVVYTADQDIDEVKELYSTPLVFDVDIKDIIYIINHFPEEDLDVGSRGPLIASLEKIENLACAGNLSEAINQLQEFKMSVEAQGQNIKKTSADIINAGADYSLTLWKSVNNQELNTPAFDFIVDNNKLIDLINGLPNGDLADNSKSNLVAMLELAEYEAVNSKIGAAIQKLQTFKNEVEMLRDNGVNSATADNLISNADNLINHLNAMLLNVQACST